MNQRRVILAAAVWLAVSTALRADAIKKTDGSAMGQIVETTAQEVTIEQGAVRTKVPVNEIEAVVFTDEPTRLKIARMAIEAGRYEDAVAGLATIDLGDVKRPEIRQDVQFYAALAKARIALASADEKAIQEAGSLMYDFLVGNPNSYHYLDACEMAGDLLVAIGKYDDAREQYAKVAEAPWPDYQMRAGVAVGRALLADGNVDEALKSFQSVLDTRAQGGSADRQRLAATLGKARCLAEKGQSDEAIKLAEGIISRTNPEQVTLQAQAYNTLGIAHAKAGRTKDALLAFLHVDALYFNSPNEHIEALQNLVELWTQVQKPDRAERAAKILREQYKRSPRSQQ
jgi:tetratricopeptide (TPR) repeat protein